ncbi:hypothetical protein GDO81_007433 [Engystomops pustulosus]|uniref:Uncharacterized protein n=1 Tax=Engystomops pustulosus TaxID=76066 RepID=A0AAV7C931_ENGPU|nr:hypothetical protein GDO81_007433 [Engystomops pustulosus]
MKSKLLIQLVREADTICGGEIITLRLDSLLYLSAQIVIIHLLDYRYHYCICIYHTLHVSVFREWLHMAVSKKFGLKFLFSMFFLFLSEKGQKPQYRCKTVESAIYLSRLCIVI